MSETEIKCAENEGSLYTVISIQLGEKHFRPWIQKFKNEFSNEHY